MPVDIRYHGRMRVMVFGTFDDLHPGHRYFLDRAEKHGELTVVIARDANVRRIKNRAPRYSELERAAAIRGAYPDVEVVLGHETDFLHWIHERKPDLLILGYDQHLPPGIREEDLGVRIKRLPAFEPQKWKSSLRRKDGR